MKLKLVLLLICTNFILVKAQSKWTLGAVFRPENGNRHLVQKSDYINAPNIIRMRNDIETGRLCYTFGIAAKYPLGKKSFIESGLYMSDKGYQTVEIPVTTLENPDPAINFNTMQFVYHHYYIDIPITAHYQFKLNDKYNLQTGLGICNSFNTDVYQTSYFTNEAGVTTRQKSTDKDRYNYQSYLLSGVISARVERAINERLSASVEVRGQYASSTTIKSNNIGEHLWTAGLGFGVWYKM